VDFSRAEEVGHNTIIDAPSEAIITRTYVLSLLNFQNKNMVCTDE
jgi:hypothetical protein